MGAKENEKGVLKLVHPGGFVEIHREPITAAEILKKNPRHSVTRPDVFKYPWIVVKPESVLTLGKVFYVVPNHTIYNLLKAHRKRNQHSPGQTQSPTPMNQAQNKDQKQTLMRNSDAGMTPKRRNHHRWHAQSILTTSCIGATSPEEDSDDRLRKQSKVDSWPKLNSRIKNTLLQNRLMEDAETKIRSVHPEHCRGSDPNMTAEFPRNNNSELEFKHEKEVIKLKSCLRKQDSARQSLQLKVSFLLPFEEEERQRRDEASQTEFTGCYSSSITDFSGFDCTNLVQA